MTSQEFKNYQEKMAKARRLNTLVRAALKRAKDAGIPEDFQRINKEEFKKLLCTSYNSPGAIKNLPDMIYENPQDIFKKYQFIFIDGGDKIDRKRAGFAIMFSLIAFEHNGKYELSETFIHSIEDYSGGARMSRNEYLEDISLYDVLFLSEFDPKKINPKKEASSFFDEVFEIRENFKRPTIISFQNPICERSELADNTSGMYFYDFSRCEKSRPMKNALRIRVRVEPKGDL